MKRGLLTIVLISLAAMQSTPSVFGQQLSAYPIPPEGSLWKGIATRYDARMLGPNYAHDAVNVWFDDDLGVIKRNGFTTYGTLSSTKSVRGMSRWTNTSGTEYLFVLSGTTIAYTTNGTAFTASTTNWSSADTSIASAMNKLWFTSASDGLAYWDGSTLEKSTNAATGRYVAGWRNRLWQAGIAGNRSRLDGSYYLDGNHWTLGDLVTSPTQIVIGNNDGLPINCLFGGHSNYLYVGKERGIYALGGVDRSDFNVINISPEIGCLGNKTVGSTGQDTFWLSQRGIERMRNFSIETVSDPVKDIVDGIVLNSARTRYWTQTSKTDWESGNVNGAGVGAPMSTSQYSGAVSASTITITHTSSSQFSGGTFSQTTFYSIFDSLYLLASASNTFMLDNWDGPLYNSSASWTTSASGWAVGTAGATSDPPYGQMICRVDDARTYASENRLMYITGLSNPPAGKWSATVRFRGSGQGATSDLVRWKFMYDTDTGRGYVINIGYISVSLKRYDGSSDVLIASTTVGNFDSLTSTHVFTVVRSTNNEFQVSMDSTELFLTKNTTHYETLENQIWPSNVGMAFDLQGSDMGCGDPEIGIDSVSASGFAYGGVYFSPVFDTGFSTAISGGLFVSSSVPTGTGLTFQVRDSSNSVNWNAWSTVVNFATPTVTNRYWQWLSSFTTSIGSFTARVDDVTLSAATSGYFISQCHNIGTEISAWDVFNANTQTEGTGVVSFEMSTGPYCNEVTVATANWHTITDGIVPTLDTGAYVAIRALLNPQWPNAPVRLHDFEVNWIEGASSQLPTGCIDLDGRYWLMYTTSSASNATLDSALVYQKNGEWTRHYGITALSCGQFNKRWYTGDSGATGKVHQQNTGYSDAGTPIFAMLETPDYSLSCAEKASGWICYKNFRKLNLDLYNAGDASTFNTQYMINGNGTWYDLGSVTLSEDSKYIHAELPWSQEQAQEGKFLRLKFWNNTDGQDLRFHRGVLIYEALPPDF